MGLCHCRCSIDCPPPFPDFMEIFHRTLDVQPWLRKQLEEMKIANWQSPCCTYSPSLMGNMSQFNRYRCMRASVLDMQCYTTTSTTTLAPTSTAKTLPPSLASSSLSTGEPETSLRTSKTWTSPPSSSRGVTIPTYFTSVEVTIPSDSSSTHKPTIPVGINTIFPPGTPVAAGSSGDKVDKRTVAIACAAVGALLIIFIIIGLICR